MGDSGGFIGEGWSMGCGPERGVARTDGDLIDPMCGLTNGDRFSFSECAGSPRVLENITPAQSQPLCGGDSLRARCSCGWRQTVSFLKFSFSAAFRFAGSGGAPRGAPCSKPACPDPNVTRDAGPGAWVVRPKRRVFGLWGPRVRSRCFR